MTRQRSNPRNLPGRSLSIGCVWLAAALGLNPHINPVHAAGRDSADPAGAVAQRIEPTRSQATPSTTPLAQSEPVKQATYTDITAEDAWTSFVMGYRVVFLDVRETYEYAAGHVPYATNMPWLSNYLRNHHQELPTGKPIIVYCAAGSRSRPASQFLVDNGHTDIYNMLGGFAAWPNRETRARRWQWYR